MLETSGVDQDLLYEYLDRWEQCRTAGCPVPLEQLCADRRDLEQPLRELVERLRATEWLEVGETDGDRPELSGALSAQPDTSRLPPSSMSPMEFTKQVTELGVLTEEELLDIERACSGQLSSDTTSFASKLVGAGKLTPYQAKALLEGRGDQLLLDRYLLLDTLDSGGMGLVYKALHQPMDRVVALKVLPPGVVDSPDKVERFRREAVAAAKLSHPNIAAAYDAVHTTGIDFLVMEYVRGTDLQKHVREHGPFSPGQAIYCTLQAARGLQHAHDQGIIHRDIKPANLVLDREGTVKVIDLGLARIQSITSAAAEKDDLTGEGTVVGTVAYMAPEQALETRQADTRSDIYSLGATLHYLLTGRAPYSENTSLQILVAHREHPVPSLTDGCHGISQRLDEIFQRMMAKDPADRYDSMRDVIVALESCNVDPEPVFAARAIRDTAAPTESVNLVSGALELAGGAETNKVHRSDTQPTAAPKADREPVQRHRFRSALAATAAGALILFAGIVIVIKSRDGTTTRINAPAGSEVSIEFDSAGQSQVDSKQEFTGRPEVPPSLPRAPFGTRQAAAYQKAWADHLNVAIEVESSVGMKLRLIPPGEFGMGSTAAEVDSDVSMNINEHPQHRVRITNAFYIGVYEVTQQEYQRVTSENPSRIVGPGTDRHPVECSGWHRAVAFCNALSQLDGLEPYYDADGSARGGVGYRLPTEAEWEHACRAGTETPYWFGADRGELRKHAWAGAGDATHPVGLLLPNPFGLYDMHGNVWEWCQDWYSTEEYARRSDDAQLPVENPSGPTLGVYKTLRGGSWSDHPHRSRAAERSLLATDGASEDDGFRIVRNVLQSK